MDVESLHAECAIHENVIDGQEREGSWKCRELSSELSGCAAITEGARQDSMRSRAREAVKIPQDHRGCSRSKAIHAGRELLRLD